MAVATPEPEGDRHLKPLAIVSLHASPVAALGAGENGGMNVYVRAVCEELSRRGIATEVFTRRSSEQGPDRVRLAERSWVTRLAVGPAEDIEKARLFDLLPDFSEAILSEQRRRRGRDGRARASDRGGAGDRTELRPPDRLQRPGGRRPHSSLQRIAKPAERGRAWRGPRGLLPTADGGASHAPRSGQRARRRLRGTPRAPQGCRNRHPCDGTSGF